jgi:hypothetical protein
MAAFNYFTYLTLDLPANRLANKLYNSPANQLDGLTADQLDGLTVDQLDGLPANQLDGLPAKLSKTEIITFNDWVDAMPIDLVKIICEYSDELTQILPYLGVIPSNKIEMSVADLSIMHQGFIDGKKKYFQNKYLELCLGGIINNPKKFFANMVIRMRPIDRFSDFENYTVYSNELYNKTKYKINRVIGYIIPLMRLDQGVREKFFDSKFDELIIDWGDMKMDLIQNLNISKLTIIGYETHNGDMKIYPPAETLELINFINEIKNISESTKNLIIKSTPIIKKLPQNLEYYEAKIINTPLPPSVQKIHFRYHYKTIKNTYIPENVKLIKFSTLFNKFSWKSIPSSLIEIHFKHDMGELNINEIVGKINTFLDHYYLGLLPNLTIINVNKQNIIDMLPKHICLSASFNAKINWKIPSNIKSITFPKGYNKKIIKQAFHHNQILINNDIINIS